MDRILPPSFAFVRLLLWFFELVSFPDIPFRLLRGRMRPSLQMWVLQTFSDFPFLNCAYSYVDHLHQERCYFRDVRSVSVHCTQPEFTQRNILKRHDLVSAALLVIPVQSYDQLIAAAEAQRVTIHCIRQI